jgi:hypothetical protein
LQKFFLYSVFPLIDFIVWKSEFFRHCWYSNPFLTKILSAFAEDHGLVEDPVLAGPVDECENDFPIGLKDRRCATARCHPEAVVDNRVVAEGEDG